MMDEVPELRHRRRGWTVLRELWCSVGETEVPELWAQTTSRSPIL